jgi:hypothetical protein
MCEGRIILKQTKCQPERSRNAARKIQTPVELKKKIACPSKKSSSQLKLIKHLLCAWPY